MSGNLIEHSLPCPDCGHKGCYTVYTNGTYCFSCHKSTQEEGVGFDIKKLEIPLPMPLYNNTDNAYKWLYNKYYITKDMADKYNIGFSPKYTIFSKEGEAKNMEKGLILPSYLDGEFLGYQAKQLSGNSGKLKYISQTNKGLVYITTQTSSNTRDLCITEDWLSAIRVGEVMPALALGSSNISRKLLELVKQMAPDNIYIWLDPDQAGREGTQKVSEKLQENLTNCKVCSIMEPCEPKECNPQELVNKLNKYLPVLNIEDIEFKPDPNFLNRINNERFKWRLDCLNEWTNGVYSGMLIEVTAPKNTGKTKLGVSEMTYFATQEELLNGRQLLFFNNEEEDELLYRYMQAAMLNCSYYDILKGDQDEIKKQYYLKGGNNLKLIPTKVFSSVDFIKHTLDAYRGEPPIICIDLANKLKPPSYKGTQSRIEQKTLAAELRQICKDYTTTMLALLQGGTHLVYTDKDTQQKRYKMYPGMEDTDESKQLAAEADIFIGLGRTEERSKTRYINIDKIKIPAEGQNPEDMKRQIAFNPLTCRYEDIK